MVGDSSAGYEPNLDAVQDRGKGPSSHFAFFFYTKENELKLSDTRVTKKKKKKKKIS